MCLAENIYYPACGCWVSYEIVSTCIRSHSGGGGPCRELVVEGVTRKSGICIPCQRKQRPQQCAVGRTLSSFMDDINESGRGTATERPLSSGSSSGGSDTDSIRTPESSLARDQALDAVRIRNSSLSDFEDDGDSVAGSVEEDMSSQVSIGSQDSQDSQDSQGSQSSQLSGYLELYKPPACCQWYYVAATRPSPPEPGSEDLESLFGGMTIVEEGPFDQDTPAPSAPEVKHPEKGLSISDTYSEVKQVDHMPETDHPEPQIGSLARMSGA